MIEQLLISVDPCEVRGAVLGDGRLCDYFVEPGDAGSRVGDVYLGRVSRVVPAINAAFVDCGFERDGFLSFRDVSGDTERGDAGPHEGQALTVQVSRDAIADKGARLTTRITLPGRFLVLCPGEDGISISRRIADEDERRRLAEGLAPAARGLGARIIARTAAEGGDIADLIADMEFLRDALDAIENARERAQPPTLLRMELGPVERFMRDYGGGTPERIVIDDAAGFAAARAFAHRLQPGLADLLMLHEDRASLFRAYGIDGEIDGLMEPRIGLASGGALLIHAADALTVIDVDSAGHTARNAGRAAAEAINIEAAAEVARQLRLRNLGGLIVIDFIGMSDAGAGERVVAVLAKAVRDDPAPVRLSAMSEFGVVELTRRRTRPSLAEILGEPCPACDGAGRVRTVRAVAADIVRLGLRAARASPGRTLSVMAAPDVIAALRDGPLDLAAAIERTAGAPVELIAEQARARDRFDIAVA